MLLMISMISESGSPVRTRRLQFRRQRRLVASLVLVGVLFGGCGLPWSEPAAPATAVAAASVDPEVESFSCPGVPDSSVRAVAGEVVFAPSWGREKDGAIRHLMCYGDSGRSGESYLFKSEFGRQVPGSPAGSRTYLYGGNERFTVDGVPEAVGEIHIDGSVGLAIITCGDAFVNVSFDPYSIPDGDLKGNLINIAISMTPWVCNGEVIPGLGVPLSPARPDTATIAPATASASETPTPQPAPEDG